MLRDFKFLRRNSGKQSDEIENVPVNPRDSLASQTSADSSRPPLNTIQDPVPPSPKPKFEKESATGGSKIDRTPIKPKPKKSDSTLPVRTPDKQAFHVKNRFGWAQRNEPSSIPSESCDEMRPDMNNYPVQLSRGGLPNMTPRSTRTVGRPTSSHSETNSTQSTPTKSVSKPTSSGYRSKFDGGIGGGRAGNFAALYRGVPVTGGSSTTVVNTVEVPHFDLKEDPSFWMDHNVQSMHGYNRCLKQESAQSITWIGQSETRFTFDHVACETVDQEMLFRMAGLPMVENCLSGYNSCMFAYGQTGSGKTYTMLGEIDDLEVKPSPHRGMTPRIFEFLFARIQAEEESRSDERLKYSCKCSFLEIYNEQITDLLDPSSTYLHLREDVKQGVYVENLSEFEVRTVSDILKLLTQGSVNRKVAATNMNKESSRSHSVFTCAIESRWEKDSTTNVRFARLNLVDLAGSERQKSSGAEGERLKEAANINKSLSTLGHVIMILVDVANGKPKHVPYRDSRLTFLLQDSLGGNSKTMIIANVSPSICCAAETLNTLKFAQRAKLIQNNAVVNEDSTGDIIALQHQIRLLKEELSLLKRQNVFRSLSFGSTVKDTTQAQHTACSEKMYETDQQHVDGSLALESKGIIRMSTKQLKSLETTLAGALRREQMAETCTKKLEAEIEHLNRLVRQREEETRSTKMMVRFREDKIHRMESLLGGSLPQDTYLLEENKALCEEIQMLQAKVDKNPEVTRFALENIRLLDQLRRFQEFYEEGERDILLDEVSNLREQLLHHLDGKSIWHNHPNVNGQPQEAMCISNQDNSLHLELKNTVNELEECRRNLNSCLEENQKLSREINDLQFMLDNIKSTTRDNDGNIKSIKDFQDTSEALASELDILEGVENGMECIYTTSVMKHAEEILDLQLELDILKIILKEERSIHGEVEERTICLSRELEMAKEKVLFVSKQFGDATHELKEAKSVVEALESEQILAINEMENLRKSNRHYVELLHEKQIEIMELKDQLSRKELRDYQSEGKDSTLQIKLKRMQDSFEKAKRLNLWYQNDHAFKATNEEEMDEVRRQAEAETAEVIVCLQEELSILQQQVHNCHLKEKETNNTVTLLENELKELQGKLHLLTEDNKELHGKLIGKDEELRKLSTEWELLACEIAEILADGQEALTDASDQLDLISSTFPHKRIWIPEQVGRLIRIISEKELLIEELGKCLEDANNKRSDVECMLKSLRGAAVVINEAHQQECHEKEKENFLLKSLLKEKTTTVAELEGKVKLAQLHANKSSICATAAFVIVNRLSELNVNNLDELKYKDFQLSESIEINQRKCALLENQAAAIKEAEEEIESLRMKQVQLKDTCAQLQRRLLEEEKRANFMEQKLEEEENDILKTREKLTELKTGVSSLMSCMSISLKHDRSAKMNETNVACVPLDSSNGRTDAGEDLRAHVPECSLEKGSRCRKSEEFRTSKDVSDRDVTIILLKKEIESALESLQEVQVEMAKLRSEKEEIRISEKRSQESLKCFTTLILAIQADMSNFENLFELKMNAINHKLQSFEQIVQEAGTHWCQTKEFLEMEVGDAKMVAAQKAAEASCIFAKFEEAQDTMKEADIMINELIIANETMKLDMERLKEIEITLTNEKDMLINEVKRLHSLNSLKDLQVEDLEKQFGLNLMETNDLVEELEDSIAKLQTTFKENLKSLACDFHSIKTLVLDKGKLVRSWLEDVWSEIIMKDSAVSVLHLCHMGILLETVTGLNTENGLLQHGLCESNTIIAGLREHNSKSNRELQMCRTLKGKLLADMKNSFDRILRKETETGELSTKLNSFEKKIFDLQLQEQLMLQRSNYMGSQLSILMKDLDFSNRKIDESLIDQEIMRKEKEELLNSEAELFMIELWSKDIESLVLASQLEEMFIEKVIAERKHINCGSDLEHLKEEMIFLMVDGNLKDQVLLAKDAEVALLQKEVEEAQREAQYLLSRLNQSHLRVVEIEEANRALEGEIQLLKDFACSNDALKGEMGEAMEAKVRLLSQVEKLEVECEKLLKDLKAKETALDSSSSHISILDQQNQKLQEDICLLETSMSTLQSELDNKDGELSRIKCLEGENESLKGEVWKLKIDNSLFLKDLEEKSSEIELSSSRISTSDMKNHRLQDRILSLETHIAGLETDLKIKSAKVNELLHYQSVVMEDLSSKGQDLQIFVNDVNTLKNEKILLKKELKSHKKATLEALALSSLNTMKCVDSLGNVNVTSHKFFNLLEKESNMVVEKMFHEICEATERTFQFIKEIECLECHAKQLVSDNMSLQAELLRKDDILKGLLFDLSLLQESASNTKDQKDKIEEMMASFEALEDELVVKSSELVEAVAHNQMLESQLQEKMGIISALELDFAKEHESLKLCSCENLELRAQIEEALAAKNSLEEELTERKNLTESLEVELSQMGNALGQMNSTVESLRNNLDDLANERDQLHTEMHNLKEQLEKAQAWAEENEAIALEAQQIAESKKVYAEEKEVEVKLLERSVEELECTINVLENKFEILNGETERQRLQREELEVELHAVNHQMQKIRSVDTDIKRHLDEKEKGLEEALKHIQVLGRDIAEKDAEIAQCKAHISELNLHAEAQASEYKEKFKALEAMTEQVKPEGHFSHIGNSSSNKLEKNAAKSRGSGSPFKCIGLGLAQQIKSERDEELTAARLHIEELESLAVSRQKEIFALNARLAAAESMTHDVIRDLLGVKLDMTNYVSLLDNQQLQKIAEKAQLNSFEPQPKEQQEVMKLKQQLNEFIEERRGWLEEIDRRQAEMVAAQIALEKLRQRDQLLQAENEMLKTENANNKKRVMQLEADVKKLSGQQNLQQRIHHHAKIKEENNLLKLQNEDLSAKLQRTEIILSRVKEELAHYRASIGKSPYINFDEEQQLINKLKEAEDDRVQIAQKLVGLCTSILKAAGITKPVSNISPAVAEEALEQMKNRLASLERECQDLTFKNRITNERARLSELMPQRSPINSRTDENCKTPKRGQTPFLSALDR
ncbi:kinesin-like protein KIN-12D isoform X2 [Hevea brasiliensis]|uniref:kinesin-like protein KIN-12D isoform X2 n=1 Tax=Hevea brasiliensis TaxID=3981 RepID=UPI0025EACFA4|nr:kinesin-like protein KIN-12D isoform X2 [Hevea brasiliensis]